MEQAVVCLVLAVAMVAEEVLGHPGLEVVLEDFQEKEPEAVLEMVLEDFEDAVLGVC